MKKTLVALAVTAFAASAYAAPVFENETTKVDFWGSLRVGFDKVSSKKTEAGKTTKTSGNTNLSNQGSRFGVKVDHQLGDGFYALGGLDFRFDDASFYNNGANANDTSRFGELHTRRAFVGLGKKEIGQITFGEQLTLADDYGLTDDKKLGFTPSYITTEATSVIQYKYQGIEGLTLGANYNFKQTHDTRGTAFSAKGDPNVKNEWGVGAVYQTNIADDQTFLIEGGYGRTNYETNANYKHYRDGYEMAVGYQIGGFRVFSDFGAKDVKKGKGKSEAFYVAPGAWYQINDKTKVYANYLYEHDEVKSSGNGLVKGNETKTHGVLAFVEYKLHKNVSVYLEGMIKKTKKEKDNKLVSKTTDKGVATGLWVNW